MKTRTDFVSNSSSSSFIVVRGTGREQASLPGVERGARLTLPDPSIGQAMFSWETCIYDQPGQKANWTACILISMRELEARPELVDGGRKPKHFGRFAEYSERFARVMKERFGVEVELLPNRSEDYSWGIDHQSDYWESPENADMLETDEALADFLCREDSHVDNSNDNGGRSDLCCGCSDEDEEEDY